MRGIEERREAEKYKVHMLIVELSAIKAMENTADEILY